MKQFEYIVKMVHIGGYSKLLNELGKDGWELVNSFRLENVNMFCTFKRELPTRVIHGQDLHGS